MMNEWHCRFNSVDDRDSCRFACHNARKPRSDTKARNAIVTHDSHLIRSEWCVKCIFRAKSCNSLKCYSIYEWLACARLIHTSAFKAVKPAPHPVFVMLVHSCRCCGFCYRAKSVHAIIINHAWNEVHGIDSSLINMFAACGVCLAPAHAFAYIWKQNAK